MHKYNIQVIIIIKKKGLGSCKQRPKEAVLLSEKTACKTFEGLKPGKSQDALHKVSNANMVNRGGDSLDIIG